MPRSLSRSLYVVFALTAATVVFGAPALGAKPIRVGLMADFTGLPFLVAEKEGLFTSEGVSVEFKIFRSAVERDAALQAGALDGCNADVIAAIANRNGGYNLQIVSSALNRFSLIAGPAIVAKAKKAGRVPTVADLAGTSVGLSSNTVIEYVVDTLMTGAKVASYKKTDVARIPVRMELLLQGKLDAASLPLPFDELAVAGGCRIVADSVSAGLDPDLFMFYRTDLEARKDSYRAFWRAIDAARTRITASPDKYRSLLSDRLGFSEEQGRAVAFPAFPKYAPTSSAEVARASAWMLTRGLIAKNVEYADIVATGVLP
ncbi:MAG: ABC transporter substrate-binding protein [Treponemataceae bacterium]